MMLRRGVIAAAFLLAPLVVFACDDFGGGDGPSEGAEAGPVEAAADAPTTHPTADAPASPCDARGPFVRYDLLSSLSTDSTEVHPTLTADELEVYFGRVGATAGIAKIYRSKRTTPTEPFPPATLTELDAEGLDFMHLPGVSPDGRELMVTTRPGNNASTTSLRIATRASREARFGQTAALSTLDATGKNRMPSFSGDGARVYFSSERGGTDAGAGKTETLWASDAAGDGSFGEPRMLVDEAGAPVIGFSPVPSADGGTIYFSRYTTTDLTEIRIFVADLDPATLRVKAATTVTPPPSSSGDALVHAGPTFEAAGHLSLDRCRLYFSAGLTHNNVFDLYVAHRR